MDGFLEAHSSSHKMRTKGNALGLALPLVAPVKGLGNTQRGMTFVKVASDVGVSLDKWKEGDPLMFAPSPNGDFRQTADYV